jgi:RNA polymerase sigma-70 factor (ECF subfamily)
VTERELVDRCRRGDRQAREEIYTRTSEHIYRLLLRMTRNPDDAFDLAQETYVRAFSRIEDFGGHSSLGTWLFRIAINEALQFARRSERERRKLRRVPASDGAESDTSTRSTAALDVRDALQALPTADRAVLLLRYQEGLDYRAIAETIGCSEGTVASRLSRARRRMKEFLAGAYGRLEETTGPAHQKG